MIRLPTLNALGLLSVCAIAAAWAGQDWKTKGTELDNRYEGFIREPSANPDWELLSFTTGRPPIPAGSTIRVAFYLPPQLAAFTSSTIVVAQELEDFEHYRMESKPRAWRQGWNVFEPWKTSDVIDQRAGVRSNLGVAVYPEPGRATATEVLPAVMVAAPGPIDAAVTSYEAVMRSSRTVSAIVSRLDRIEGTSVVRVWEQRAPGEFIREEPIQLDVKVPSAQGRYRLLVCATPTRVLPEQQSAATANCAANDIERHYTFHHVPRVNVSGSQ
jgi:hypothetical protein